MVGWQVPLIWFGEEIAWGLRKREVNLDKTTSQKGLDCWVCAGALGGLGRPRTFQGQGACTTATGKLMFLFEGLYMNSLINRSRSRPRDHTNGRRSGSILVPGGRFLARKAPSFCRALGPHGGPAPKRLQGSGGEPVPGD